MNARIGKHFSCLVVLVLVFNLVVPVAAAARVCADHPCCCRGATAMSHNKPHADRYFTTNGCCSDASRIPCNLIDDFGWRSSIFAVSSTRHPVSGETGRLVSAGVAAPFIGTAIAPGAKNSFQIPIDPVPLYLHHRSLIC